jgi:hypothetical protein
MNAHLHRTEHERAQMLIALSGPDGISAAEQGWLTAHLDACVSCREFAENSRKTINALRTISVTASGSLVSTTQRRVRQRALELQRQQERLWMICVCCIAVTLGTAFTTAILWGGMTWMGQQARLSNPVWQIGLVGLGLMPAIVAAIMLLARGTYMADHNGTYQG